MKIAASLVFFFVTVGLGIWIRILGGSNAYLLWFLSLVSFTCTLLVVLSMLLKGMSDEEQ